MLNYYTAGSGSPVYKIVFEYAADNEENKAALNFHLTKREEKNIVSSLYSSSNQESFRKTLELFTLPARADSVRVE